LEEQACCGDRDLNRNSPQDVRKGRPARPQQVKTYTNIDFDSRGQGPGNTYYHQVNSRLTYQSPVGLSGFLQASYIDGSPFTNADFSPGRLPTYTNFFLLNGKLMYEVRKGIKPYVAIENLLDSNYERNPGFPEPGRRICIGLHATF
jgi:outer membrane receptor for ferrienterochelin and colicin